MQVFVIHTSKSRKDAKCILKSYSEFLSFKIKTIFLENSKGDNWKEEAKELMQNSEVVIVYNPEESRNSENTLWEIKLANELKKEIIEIEGSNNKEDVLLKLKSAYNFEIEFEECFSNKSDGNLEFYKLMLESSEQLIQRRQKTNAFFITILGSLLAVAGLMVRIGNLTIITETILYSFAAVGMLLCYSWRNLIDNYGKLNTAKFDVILRLERDFENKIYTAEWVALGKGNKPQKYKSFTETEKNIPLIFGLLIFVLTFASLIMSIGEYISNQIIEWFVLSMNCF